jgi:hypothetical protein
MEFAIITATHNFDCDKSEKYIQIWLIHLQLDSVVEEKFSSVGVPVFCTYLSASISRNYSVFLPNMCDAFTTLFLEIVLIFETKQELRKLTINRSYTFVIHNEGGVNKNLNLILII